MGSGNKKWEAGFSYISACGCFACCPHSLQFCHPGLVLQRKQLLSEGVKCFVSDMHNTLA